MGRGEQIRSDLYRIAGVDFILVFLATVVLVLRPRDALAVAPVCFLLLLLSNVVLLRRKRRTSAAKSDEATVSRSPTLSAYFLAVFYFVGTLYGVLLILEGEIPRAVALFLLVPLLLAVHCLRTARGSSRGNLIRKSE